MCRKRNLKIKKLLTKLQQNLVSAMRDTDNNNTLFMYYLIPGNNISVWNFPSDFFQYTKNLSKKVKFK